VQPRAHRTEPGHPPLNISAAMIRISRVTRRTILAVILASALVATAWTPVRAADRKPPKVGKAVMADKDDDGFADRVVITYTEKIRHRADDDGTYPFRVVGYKILRAKRAWNQRELTLLLTEKLKTDPAARPDVLYDRGRDEGVFDRAGNEARTQTFKGTKPFVNVPSGSSLLIVDVEGPGTVATLDGTFACSTSCYTIVTDTPLLTLNAEPDDGASFQGWSGACADSGTQTFCPLVVDSNKSVGASFQ
jgi:Divergent InlB B-repeat domain